VGFPIDKYLTNTNKKSLLLIYVIMGGVRSPSITSVPPLIVDSKFVSTNALLNIFFSFCSQPFHFYNFKYFIELLAMLLLD
jgi:hypothetical protein